MSHKREPSLILAIKSSNRLIILVITVNALALGAVIANALAVSVKIGISALICIYCWRTLKRLRAEHYIIKHTDERGWEVSEGVDFFPIEILRSTVITTFCLLLHYKQNSQAQVGASNDKKTLLVLNDALAEEDYRRLIVKLKITAIKKN